MNAHLSFNPQIHRVIQFSIVDDYTILLVFDDQTEQVIDFEPILVGPIFGPLRDTTLFNQVELNTTFGTLEWPNGADISPAVLYDWEHHIEAMIAHRRNAAIII